jgi:3-oxo-5alpha-steroid 4-dehydrogenase
MGQSVGTDVRLLGEAIAYNAIYGPHESLVKGILVNDRGQRYVGEDNYGDWVGDLTARHYPASYLIIDEKIMQGIPEDARKALQPDAPVNGLVAQADSVAELAKALKIPVPLLENTIKQYNEMSAAGEDIQFQKNAKYMQGISAGPFYALDFSPKGIWFVTKGGLKINKKSQALDPEGKPVPGLYCAGTICSQIIAQHYPGSGTLNGQALTFGRIAGQNVAAEKPI